MSTLKFNGAFEHKACANTERVLVMCCRSSAACWSIIGKGNTKAAVMCIPLLCVDWISLKTDSLHPGWVSEESPSVFFSSFIVAFHKGAWLCTILASKGDKEFLYFPCLRKIALLLSKHQNMFTTIGHHYANDIRVYYSDIVCLS